MKLLWLILASSSLYGQVIVSDYDDTFRISFSYDIKKAAASYIKKTRYLADYKILFQEIWEGPKYLLSSSPSLFLNRIKRDLKKNQIDYIKFIARKPKDQFNKNYKVKELTRLLKNQSQSIILIGDDIHKDEAVYKTIQRIYHKKTVTYYIRNTQSDISLDGKYNYALDIALQEWHRKRLSLVKLDKFLIKLSQTPLNLINVKGYACPIINLNRGLLGIIARLPKSFYQKVLDFYESLSKDCFIKKDYRF